MLMKTVLPPSFDFFIVLLKKNDNLLYCIFQEEKTELKSHLQKTACGYVK